MSIATDLVDGIVDGLNRIDPGSWPVVFVAERAQVPMVADRNAMDLRVMVFTGTREAERIGRGDFSHTYKPVITIHKRLGIGNATTVRIGEVDQLQALVEAVEAALESSTFGTIAGCSFEGYEGNDVESYDLEMLKANVFASFITLNYLR